MMRTLVLFYAGADLYGIDKEVIIGITHRGNANVHIKQIDGHDHLELPQGEASPVYDLEQIFSLPLSPKNQTTLLIIDYGEGPVTLQTSGRGRIASVDEQALQPLPPLLRQTCKDIFPAMLLNGTDTIFLLSPHALLQSFNNEEKQSVSA